MFVAGPELKGYFEGSSLELYVRSIETVEIGDVVVDVRNVLDRRFICDGTCCLESAGGNTEVKGDCCYGASDVLLSDTERERLAAHLEGIIPYMTMEAREWLEVSLARNRGDKALSFSRPYTWKGKPSGLFALRLHKGKCLFRVLEQQDGKRYVRCAIHKYCLDRGLAIWELKPLRCWLWPLALVPLHGGRLWLTVHTPDNYTFTDEAKGWTKKACLSSPPPDAPFIYQTFAAELRYLFGEAFYERLSDLAKRRAEGRQCCAR